MCGGDESVAFAAEPLHCGGYSDSGNTYKQVKIGKRARRVLGWIAGQVGSSSPLPGTLTPREDYLSNLG